MGIKTYEFDIAGNSEGEAYHGALKMLEAAHRAGLKTFVLYANGPGGEWPCICIEGETLDVLKIVHEHYDPEMSPMDLVETHEWDEEG